MEKRRAVVRRIENAGLAAPVPSAITWPWRIRDLLVNGGRRIEEHPESERAPPMHVIRRRGWEIPERLATPERLFFNRRAFLAASGAAALSLSPELALAQRIADLPDPTGDLYPLKRNEKYLLDRPITDERTNNNYNNFYEFGSSKTIAKAAQALKLRPWTIKIDGMVEKAQDIGVDDLIRKMPLEERLYRHRCVEACRWPLRGRASRSASWWNWPSRCRRRNTSGWRPSAILRRPRASARPGIHGHTSRA